MKVNLILYNIIYLTCQGRDCVEVLKRICLCMQVYSAMCRNVQREVRKERRHTPQDKNTQLLPSFRKKLFRFHNLSHNYAAQCQQRVRFIVLNLMPVGAPTQLQVCPPTHFYGVTATRIVDQMQYGHSTHILLMKCFASGDVRKSYNHRKVSRLEHVV